MCFLLWLQVHRAVLHSGEGVVVKVQRPGLKQLFDIDLNNLRILAEQLDKGDDNRDFKVGALPAVLPNMQSVPGPPTGLHMPRAHSVCLCWHVYVGNERGGLHGGI
jgi:hypothetical protein